MVVLLKEGSIARRRGARRARRALAGRAGLAAGPARRAARRPAVRARAVPCRVRLGRPALPAGLAAAAAGGLRRASSSPRRARGPGPGGALGAWARLPRRPPDGDPRAGRRRRVRRPRCRSSWPRRCASSCSRCGSTRARRPLAFGALAGLLCGTVGFASEYGWSQLVMPLPWTEALLPEGLICAALAGLAAGVLGRALRRRRCAGALPPRRVARLACVGAFAVLLGVGDQRRHQARARRPRPRSSSTDVQPRAAAARRSPPSASTRPTPPRAPTGSTCSRGRAATTGWSTGCEQVGDGVYRSTSRSRSTATGRSACGSTAAASGAPWRMRLPVDPGLPNAAADAPGRSDPRRSSSGRWSASAGAELPAPASFSRPFGDDNLIVLRETKGDVPGWLWLLAMALTALLWGLFIAGLTLGLGRMARRSGEPRPRRPGAVPLIPNPVGDLLKRVDGTLGTVDDLLVRVNASLDEVSGTLTRSTASSARSTKRSASRRASARRDGRPGRGARAARGARGRDEAAPPGARDGGEAGRDPPDRDRPRLARVQ